MAIHYVSTIRHQTCESKRSHIRRSIMIGPSYDSDQPLLDEHTGRTIYRRHTDGTVIWHSNIVSADTSCPYGDASVPSQVRRQNMYNDMYKMMKKQLLASNVIYADETVVQVLKEEGKAPQSESSGERCKRFLSSFTGCLVTDGYAGYNAVENVTRCGCWAHMRRAWRDAMPKGATTENSKAAVGYNYCNKLFALERKWKNLNNAQREENRRNQAEKMVDEYFLWVRSIDPVSGSKLEDAVKYALNQEKYLRAFLNNGEVEISNNFAENAIRPFVIGRKNWLFSDTVKGAKSSAIVYSLIETAKANGVEPYAYLALVLTDMQYMGKPFSNEELESLMPWSEEMKQSIVRRTKPTSSSDE